MARHRSGSPRSGRAGPAVSPPDAAPRTGSWPAALDAPATGPRTARGKHRHDPATTPLDLAAIARAAAAAREDGHPADTGGFATGPATPAPGVPAPEHAPAASHRAPRTGRLLTSTRAAGALALFGALTGATVAAASTGSSLLADPGADTGEIVRPAAAIAPAGLSEPAARAATAAPHSAASVAPHTTTAAPTTSAAPPTVRDDGGKTLWSADFASAGLKNFRSTPWNNQGASSPTVGGGQLNFSMPGGGKRSEVEPKFKALSEGDEYYFGFSVKLAPDFPVGTSDWQVITQFKNDGTGSPPLELKVQDGKFLIDGNSGGFSQVVGDATPGRWTHLALRVKFSASDGSVSAWQDGVQKIADYAPPSGTMYAGKSSYVKTGIYRDPSIGQAGKLSFGSWAIGTTLGSVSKGLPGGLD
jgi:hypothetical protein